MATPPALRAVAVLLAALAMWLLGGPGARAETLAPEPSATRTLIAPLDAATPLGLPGAVTRIVVSQPEIAKVGVAGQGGAYVMGRDTGDTNLLVYGPGNALLEVVDVRVGVDAARLQSDIQAALPGDDITVLALGHGVLLSGEVATPAAAAIAEDLAARAAPDGVTSRLHVRASQVRLEVRLVEASADDLRDLGVGLDIGDAHAAAVSGGGLIGADSPAGVVRLIGGAGGVRLNAAINGLESRGAARILARPELVALSGFPASFRSGGEFPFPVPVRDGEIAIEFRPYGAAMTFTPEVQGNGLIRLDLTSEVSFLDIRRDLRLAGVRVPSLGVRRVATTLELRDGQTLYLGGLYQSAEDRRTRQVPILGDLPVIGPLFRSERLRRDRLELAVIVTAHIDNRPGDSIAAELARRPLLAEPDALKAKPARKGLPARVAAAVTRPFRLLAEAADVARRWGWSRARVLARQAAPRAA